jgi:hypothetical protein
MTFSLFFFTRNLAKNQVMDTKQIYSGIVLGSGIVGAIYGATSCVSTELSILDQIGDRVLNTFACGTTGILLGVASPIVVPLMFCRLAFPLIGLTKDDNEKDDSKC